MQSDLRFPAAFSPLLIFLCLAPVLPAYSTGWNDHPALERYQLDNRELPDVLYLIRTTGHLPETGGITIYGERNGVFVVSGAEEEVFLLSQMGCGVFPLEMPPSTAGSPEKTWQPLLSADPLIEEMVASVNWPDIAGRLQWLVDFGTRYSYASNHLTVAEGIASVFQGYGLSPEYHSFNHSGVTLWNVLATQTGTLYPDSFYIVCGHFDSISEDPYVSAPGADDNATGTAIVLLAADILSDYTFNYSIIYICFAGEEQGLRGSQAYAQWASANGMGIAGVLNFDMLGYWEDGVEADLEIEANDSSVWLAEAILNAADLYTETPYELHVYNGAWWGDHASFWAEGFAAVNHEEAWDWGDPDFNPYYHSTNDLLDYVGEDFMVGNARLGIAALATLAQPDGSGSSIENESSEPSTATALSVYPNPFADHAVLSVSGIHQGGTASVELFNLSGRRISVLSVKLDQGSGSCTWVPEDGLEGNGVYFARISGSAEGGSARLVRIR